MTAAIGLAFWPEPKPATSVRYRFEVTGTVPTRLDMVVAGEQARIERSGTAPADVIFRCTTETFVFVLYGRCTPQDALAHGHLTVDGERDLVTAFAQWFRGV